MQTVDKALRLLKFFSPQNPMWGLSDLARAAGMNKATTLRMLSVLVKHELLEQDRETRKFYLGTAALNLAKIREATFPLSSIVSPIMKRLVLSAKETVHASVGTRSNMSVIAIEEPSRATRVYVDPSEPLPFHATASGIVFLAFSGEAVRERALSGREYEKFTAETPTKAKDIKDRVALAKEEGVAVSFETFEEEVIGIAAPFFDGAGLAQGALTIAIPTLRLSKELKRNVVSDVANGSLEIAKGMGVEPPVSYLSTVNARR